jgi:hypothetical protein
MPKFAIVTPFTVLQFIVLCLHWVRPEYHPEPVQVGVTVSVLTVQVGALWPLAMAVIAASTATKGKVRFSMQYSP